MPVLVLTYSLPSPSPKPPKRKSLFMSTALKSADTVTPSTTVRSRLTSCNVRVRLASLVSCKCRSRGVNFHDPLVERKCASVRVPSAVTAASTSV